MVLFWLIYLAEAPWGAVSGAGPSGIKVYIHPFLYCGRQIILIIDMGVSNTLIPEGLVLGAESRGASAA